MRPLIVVVASMMLLPLVLASGLDRLAATGASAGDWPFRHFGPYRLAAAARLAHERGDAAGALTLARRAVAAGPMEAANIGLLGTLAIAAGDHVLADRAFTVSAQLGWRDAAAQTYILAKAHAAGDAVVAAQRADALLRIGTPPARMAGALRLIEGMPGGIEALATQLSAAPPWGSAYIVSGADLDHNAFGRRLSVLAAARHAGFPVDCTPVGWASDRLLDARRVADGGTLWRRMGCGSADPTNFDAAARSFAEPGTLMPDAAAFRWQPSPSGDTEARIDIAPNAPARRSLYVQANAPGPVRVARRIITLPPGRYRLGWTAVDASGAPTAGLLLETRCAHDGRAIGEPEGDSAAITVTVPASRCGAQRLEIVADPMAGAAAGAWLTSIDLVRSNPTPRP